MSQCQRSQDSKFKKNTQILQQYSPAVPQLERKKDITQDATADFSYVTSQIHDTTTASSLTESTTDIPWWIIFCTLVCILITLWICYIFHYWYLKFAHQAKKKGAQVTQPAQ